jgi:hypothetical protein
MCMCVCVCLCVGFVICVVSFGNTSMCACIYCVLYCLHCVFVSFVYVYSYIFLLVLSDLPPSDKSIAVNNNKNNNINNNLLSVNL